MNRDEKNLLMYFETCLVDNGDKVEGQRMNSEDFEIAKKFKEEGLIDFGRLPASEALSDKQKSRSHHTHWVHFMPDTKAWELAHKFRRQKAIDVKFQFTKLIREL